MKKITKSILVCSIFCFVLSASLFAEDKNVFEKYPDSFGGFYGDAAGAGLSWQHWFERIGVEAAGGYNYSTYYDDTTESRTIQVNIGAQIQYLLYSYEFSDWLAGGFYLFGGAKFSNTSKYFISASEEHTPSFGTGAGLGIEPVVLGRYSLPIEVGYGARWSGFTTMLPDYAGVIVQAGVRYRL